MASKDHSHEDEYYAHAHITPTRTYVGILGVLLVFTVLTWAVSLVHLGGWNLIVAVVIATAKASLVVLYFMHMKYEAKFNALVFVGSLLFLGIFLAYTLNDTETRAVVDSQNGSRIDPATGQFAHGTAAELVVQHEMRLEAAEAASARAAEPTGAAAGAAVDAGSEPRAEAAEPAAADAGVAAEQAEPTDEQAVGEAEEGTSGAGAPRAEAEPAAPTGAAAQEPPEGGAPPSTDEPSEP